MPSRMNRGPFSMDNNGGGPYMTTRVRKSNRLQNYDYFQAGYYFVTICTQNRKELFGEIVDSQMVTNTAGEMVIKTWNELPKFYHGIQMDQFQIMPNHVHGIIVIVGDGPRAVPNEPRALPDGQPQGVVPTLSLSNVVHRFKTLATRLYVQGVHKKGWKPFNAKLWQRSFYDHIIRDEQSLNDIREYIQNNPLDWELDENNPSRGRPPCRPA